MSDDRAIFDRVSSRDLWPRQTRVARPLAQRAVNGLVMPSWQLDRPIWPDRNIRTFADFHAASTTLFAAVLYRANAVASADVKLYQLVDGDREEQPDHPLRQLLSRPNAGQSEAEFLALVQAVADVAGFAPIEKVRSEAGRVVNLHVLRPDWCRPIYREQAEPDWEYRIPGRPPVLIPAADMLIYTPVGSLDRSATGMSAVSVALRQLGIERAMTDFLAALFQRGALPLIGLVLDPDVTDPQADAAFIKAQYKDTYGGAGNWAEPVVMTAIREIQRLGYDLNELAYPDLRDATEVAICQVFGVPPILIGAKVGLDQATYSNYEQARRSFYEDTVTPLWARLDGALTRSLLPEFIDGPSWQLEFDTSDVPALKDDEAQKWAEAQTSPFMTLNEKRRHVGLPELPGGDVLILGLTDMVIPADATDLADTASTLSFQQAPAETLSERITPERRGHAPQPQLRYLPVTEQRATIGQTNRLLIARLARNGTRPMREFWQAQGERILAIINQYRSEATDHEQRQAIPPLMSLIDWQEEEEELRAVIQLLHNVAGTTAFDAISDQLGVAVAWDLANPNISRVLDRLATRIVGINNTTREHVRMEVEQALANGETVDDLADRIRGLFEETYRGRAVTVARTETQVAYNSASAVGYAETGIVDQAQLLDNPKHTEDYGASDGLSCAQRNGLIVPLSDVSRHIEAEHPQGTLAVAPIVREGI